MQKTFRLLGEKSSLKHSFMIPCDCHGLQQHIGDILESPAYATTITSAYRLISHLHHAGKQYAVQKELQREQQAEKKPFALVCGCQTRLGSQYKSMRLIQLAEMALRRWRFDPCIYKELVKSGGGREVAAILMDPGFFHQVSEITQSIGPIVDEFAQAGGNDNHIGLFIPRWRLICQHLLMIAQVSLESYRWPTLWPKLQARLQRHITPLHKLAWWLLPSTVANGGKFDATMQEQSHVLAALKDCCHDQAEYDECRPAFLSYYTRQSLFHYSTNRGLMIIMRRSSGYSIGTTRLL